VLLSTSPAPSPTAPSLPAPPAPGHHRDRVSRASFPVVPHLVTLCATAGIIHPTWIQSTVHSRYTTGESTANDPESRHGQGWGKPRRARPATRSSATAPSAPLSCTRRRLGPCPALPRPCPAAAATSSGPTHVQGVREARDDRLKAPTGGLRSAPGTIVLRGTTPTASVGVRDWYDRARIRPATRVLRCAAGGVRPSSWRYSTDHPVPRRRQVPRPCRERTCGGVRSGA
jgi:hypothetical protein